MPIFKSSTRFRRRRFSKKTKSTGSSESAIDSVHHEVDRLASTAPNAPTCKDFKAEMNSFLELYNRYIWSKAYKSLKWDSVSIPPPDKVIPFGNLVDNLESNNSWKKLAILKVNGGLGTSMGLYGAKGALEVSKGHTFLDLIVEQVEHLNKTYNTQVPLFLMTSFNTYNDTLNVIRKHANRPVRITAFNQSKYPRLRQKTSALCPKSIDDKTDWYPPGHGDLYLSLVRSGTLDKLLNEGREYLFVSNVDNLGAIADPRILQHMISSDSEFIMEVTDKTKADIEGGALIDCEDTLQLLEIQQVPDEHIEEFKTVRTFKLLNTNNLWIDLKALRRIMDTDGMKLDIVANHKGTLEDSTLELETLAGSAIKYFKSHAVKVSRERFIPVKNCSDLLLIRSDIYAVHDGRLMMSESRIFGSTPVIKLDDHFKNIRDFQTRFKGMPHMVDLDHLTVTGDVNFGKNVVLRGAVVVCAGEGQRIDIPDGCVIENRLLSGDFRAIEL